MLIWLRHPRWHSACATGRVRDDFFQGRPPQPGARARASTPSGLPRREGCPVCSQSSCGANVHDSGLGPDRAVMADEFDLFPRRSRQPRLRSRSRGSSRFTPGVSSDARRARTHREPGGVGGEDVRCCHHLRPTRVSDGHEVAYCLDDHQVFELVEWHRLTERTSNYREFAASKGRLTGWKTVVVRADRN